MPIAGQSLADARYRTCRHKEEAGDDMIVTFVLPAGQVQTAEVSSDTLVCELIPALVTLFHLPTVGPDYQRMHYRLNSKRLGRSLTESQTLHALGVPMLDRLILATEMTAGSSLSEIPRVRRLRADHERMIELAARSNLIKIKTIESALGMPPERYIVTYKVNSVIGIDDKGEPRMGKNHQVEIYLHSDYPQRWPGLKWLTPVWHPNISHIDGSVCIDAAWWGAARSLDRLVIMMGEMLEYKNFHDDPDTPPFPWDKEAAEWCRKYRKKHPNFVPTDNRELLRPERIKLGKAPASKPRIKLK